MPDLSGNIAALNAPYHKILKGTVVFMTGVQVLLATATAPTSYPAKNVTISVDSGTITNVIEGFRVTVETSGGAFKGELRIAYGGTISTTNLPLNEFSAARVSISTGDKIRVYNIIPLTDLLVGDDIHFNPDGRVIYSDQNSNQRPIVNSGGSYVGDVQDGLSYRDVPMYGADSRTVDPDSSGALSHIWSNYNDSALTYAVGTNSSVSPTIRLSPGYTLIKHFVLDADNEKPASQYIPCYVVNAANTGYDCLITLSGDHENGWSAEIELFQDTGLANIPDGTFAMFYVREQINGTIQSFGAQVASRSHIKFTGYTVSDSNTGNYETQRVTFSLISPIARLGELPGFSKVYLTDATPERWREMKSLSTMQAIINIMRYYTTWLYTFDFIAPADARLYPAFYLTENTPLGQVRELADGLDLRFICDRVGRGELHVHPAYIAIGDRGSVTTVLTLSDSAIIEMDFQRTHSRVIKTVEGRGLSSTASLDLTAPRPFFARYPGKAPGSGSQSSVVEKMILAAAGSGAQTELNERTGRRAALIDQVFISTTGVYQRAFELRLVLFGSYDVFDFYRDWIALSITGTSNLRGIDLSAFRYWLKEARVSYENGTARTELTLQSETNSLAAEAYYPPSDITPPYIEPPVIDPVITPEFPTIIGYGVGKMAIFGVNGMARTSDFQSSFPTYDYLVYGSFAPPIGGTFCQWVPNGFEVGSGWVITTTAIYYVNIALRAAVLKHTFANAPTGGIEGRYADASFSKRTFLVVVSNEGANGFRSCITTDNCVFTEATVSAFRNTNANIGRVGCTINSRNNYVYASRFESTAANPDGDLIVSTNLGVSWSAVSPNSNPNRSLATAIHVPFGNPTTAIFTMGMPSADNAQLYRIYGGVSASVAPTLGGNLHTPMPGRDTIASSIQSPNRMLMSGWEKTEANPALWLSNNALASVPAWTAVATSTNFRRCAIAGDTPARGWAWGVSNAISQIDFVDAAPLLTDKAGNLPDFSIGSLIAIAGWGSTTFSGICFTCVEANSELITFAAAQRSRITLDNEFSDIAGDIVYDETGGQDGSPCVSAIQSSTNPAIFAYNGNLVTIIEPTSGAWNDGIVSVKFQCRWDQAPGNNPTDLFYYEIFLLDASLTVLATYTKGAPGEVRNTWNTISNTFNYTGDVHYVRVRGAVGLFGDVAPEPIRIDNVCIVKRVV